MLSICLNKASMTNATAGDWILRDLCLLVIRSIIRMDEFIDWLMREETICDVGLAQRQLEVDVKNQ